MEKYAQDGSSSEIYKFDSVRYISILKRLCGNLDKKQLFDIVQNIGEVTEDSLFTVIRNLMASSEVQNALLLREAIKIDVYSQTLSENYSSVAVELIRNIDASFYIIIKEKRRYLAEVYGEMLEFYKTVKIDSANSYAELIEYVLNLFKIENIQFSFEDYQGDDVVVRKKIKEVQVSFSRVQSQANQIHNTKEKWDEVKKDGDIEMCYKKIDDGSLKMKFDLITMVDLFNFLALIYEIELYPNWVPFCKKSEQFKEIGDFGKAAVLKFNLGKLLFKRELGVIGFGWDRLIHRGGIFIETKSIEKGDEADAYNIIVPEKKETRVDVRMMSFEIFPLKNNQVEIKGLTNADPKIWFAPNLLINFVFKKIAKVFIKKIFKLAQNIHEREWGKKMNEKKEFYDWMRNLVSGYIKNIEEEEEGLFKISKNLNQNLQAAPM